jgi:hypothetical protein
VAGTAGAVPGALSERGDGVEGTEALGLDEVDVVLFVAELLAPQAAITAPATRTGTTPIAAFNRDRLGCRIFPMVPTVGAVSVVLVCRDGRPDSTLHPRDR